MNNRPQFPPMSAAQKARLTALADAAADAYRTWLTAVATEKPDGSVTDCKTRYHALRAMFDSARAGRGLRKGDRVSMYAGPRQGEEGTVIRRRAAAVMDIEWDEGTVLATHRGTPVHAWQLLLTKPVEENR